ncbi:excalibur calcium-binding domain-containing protein [Streptomyces sp. NPDC005574]|uniref:excalibur calcium-binding domain-containing protein n=1 Tax=Streptomyces sp. NPDC005574 TaxID=3156891 RepID=UPI0033BEA320
MSNPYAVPQPPKWARKRFVLPALAVALFVGVGIGAGGDGGDTTTDAKPAAAAPRPTVTVTATTTKTAAPEPAATVTATRTVKATRTVRATRTVTAEPAEDSGADDSGSGGGDVYYANCTEARAAGAAPIRRGEPGYASHLDRDNDGIACDA